MPSLEINMIWAQTLNGVIGIDNKLPWHVPADLKHFKQLTAECPVIMGRKTWESLPTPLPNRANIVLSHTQADTAAAEIVHSPQHALEIASNLMPNKPIWIIGGGSIYQTFIPKVSNLIVTTIDIEIDKNQPNITLAPSIDPSQFSIDIHKTDKSWRKPSNNIRWRITTWRKNNVSNR